LIAAFVVAVAIVGVRQAASGIGSWVLGAVAGIGSLWLIGLLLYLVPFLLALAGFALLVALFVVALKPSRG
jgi:hypothetical protein